MRALRDLRGQLATIGPRGMITLAAQNRLGRRLRSYEVCRPLVEQARGLEIGGPSGIFARGGMLPLYPLLERLDNCDFTDETIWHGEAEEGSAFHYDARREPGRRFIRDATALDGIEDASYDVVFSSHTIEHLANPLRALAEWKRVLREDGCLVLVVPHLENTFDHRRPVTTLEHLERDLARSVPEDDETHLQEFIELCDLTRVPERLSRPAFEQRTRAFAENRTLHHHVFDTRLVVLLLDRVGFELLAVETALPFHIVAVAQAGAHGRDNSAFIADTADWRRASVFRHDRRHAAKGAPTAPG
ncbi:MAG: class I SAM-dependent methyltransferase [Actinobacteria bacterium]|nr:class I SAM-dependent methyltransferase [Actinomycetota bacterium]